MAAAIEVEGVTKAFRLYTDKPTSLKERVLRFRRVRYGHFTALRDINLDIEAGTTVGILGHNGSGKSTLLKCMAGIIQPTAGVVRVAGRMAALLELGAGFHPELSGRENVYLNGSILGLKRVEVDRVFDDIVGFAELETFIDTPVKHYSSGMYVRLGFAVAVNVDPEILLVDEVLSVGDEAFQRKCIDKVKTFQGEGRTIVVVTHAADLVRQMCDRAAALEHGSMVAQGEPNEVIREFRERLLKAATPAEDMSPELVRSELSPMWGRVKIAAALVSYATPTQDAVAPGEPMRLDVTLDAPEPVDDVVVGIAVYSSMGWLVFGTNTHLHGIDLGTVSGRRQVTFAFPEVPLLDGTYAVTIGVHTRGGLVYDSWEQLRRFEVAAPGRDIGLVRLPVAIEVDGASSPPTRADSGPAPGPVVTGRFGPAGRRHQPFVPVEHVVPVVARLHELPARPAEALPQAGVVHQQVDGGLEIREAPVGEATAAAPALPVQHIAVALHQDRFPVGPGLAQDHRETLEVRRLHQRQRARQRRLLGVVVDESGDDDVGMGLKGPDRVAHDSQGQGTGVALLVGGEEREQLLGALGGIDSPDEQEIGPLLQPESRPEGATVEPLVPLDVNAHPDDFVGPAGPEPPLDERHFLLGEVTEGGWMVKHRPEELKVQRRLVMRRRMEDRRAD